MSPQGGDFDPGPPIRALRDLEREPSPRFIERLRRRIHRRTTTTQLVSYSWHMPIVVLAEMVGVFAHFLKAFSTKKEQ